MRFAPPGLYSAQQPGYIIVAKNSSRKFYTQSKAVAELPFSLQITHIEKQPTHREVVDAEMARLATQQKTEFSERTQGGTPIHERFNEVVLGTVEEERGAIVNESA